MPEIKQVEVKKAFVRGVPNPASWSEQYNTIEMVVSTGARGLRGGFLKYYEELSLNADAVRLKRLNNGAPLLAAHDSSNLDSVIGVVEKAELRNNELVAKIRFSKDEKFRSIVERVKEGIIRKVSVGYMVHKYEELEETVDDIPIFRAVDWEPLEVSLVPVPFDDNAQIRDNEEEIQVRSEGAEKSLCHLNRILRGEKQMTPEEIEQKRIADEKAAAELAKKEEETRKAAEAKKTADAEAKAKADELVAQERARVTAIQEVAEKTGAEKEFVRELITKGVSLVDAKEQLLNRWVEKGSKVPTQGKVTVGEDKRREAFKKGITNALMHRANPKTSGNPKGVELTEVGKEFRGMSLLEMAKDMMEAAGHNTRGITKSELAGLALSREFMTRIGYHVGDDFPYLLADVANKTLRQAYEAAPRTFLPIVRFTTAPDFKNINRMQLGEAPKLELVNEHGEFTHGTMTESKETYKVKSYGKIFAMTRQMMINDDLNAFARMPGQFGVAGANLESDLVWAIFTANAAMGDGVALFHSSHGNLGTAGVISDTTLGEMRKLGRKQTGLDGVTLLNIFMKHLIVPAALETTAQKQLSLVVPNQVSGVNVFANAYNLIVEPRLDANSAISYYGSADPSQIDTIEVAYLDGQSGVRLESEIGFDVDGMRMKCAHDVGVKAIDHRGLFKNAGA